MSELGSLDSRGLWSAAAALPEALPGMLEAARHALSDATVRPVPEGPAVRAVALSGLGTGGLAAAAVAALSAPHLNLPFWCGSGADVPAFVDRHTLFVAVSASGTTHETVAAAAGAAGRGALVVAIGGEADGPLARLAADTGCPWYPTGAVGPRTVSALAAAVVTVLAVLAAAGLVPDPAPSVLSAATLLARRRDQCALPGGPAQELARRIGRTIPLVYGWEGVAATAARWWKARVNLNAKAPALAGALPAATYDELAGWGQAGDITRQVLSLVFLRHAGEAPEAEGLFEDVRAATDEVMADVLALDAAGGDDLARFLDLALVGELVSLHLAAREGVDPGPTPAIDDVRRGVRV